MLWPSGYAGVCDQEQGEIECTLAVSPNVFMRVAVEGEVFALYLNVFSFDYPRSVSYDCLICVLTVL